MTRTQSNNVIPLPRVARGRHSEAGSALPSAVDVFAEWFKSIPPGVDLELAAARAIAQIDRGRLSHPDVVLLRAMLAAFAGPRASSKPVFHR
jgi:hypothetical protein